MTKNIEQIFNKFLKTIYHKKNQNGLDGIGYKLELDY